MIKTFLLVSALQIAYRAHGNLTNDVQSKNGASIDKHRRNDWNAKYGHNTTNRKVAKTAARRLAFPPGARYDVQKIFTLTSGEAFKIIEHSEWKGAVFCPVGTFAFGFRNRHDNQPDNAQGITEITLYCKVFGHHYGEALGTTTTTITSGNDDDEGVKGEPKFCQIKKGPTRASRLIEPEYGDPTQFLIGAEGIFGIEKVGAISFAAICGLLDPNWWDNEAKLIYGPCYSNPCQNGAKCIPGNVGAGEIRYSCICEPGFMGNNCETDCCETADCSTYEGTKSRAWDNKACLYWADLKIGKEWKKKMKKQGLKKNPLNYCRNPDKNHQSAWCYIWSKPAVTIFFEKWEWKKEKTQWRNCSIPTCSDIGMRKKDPPPLYYCNGDVNRAQGGKASAKSQSDPEHSASMAFAGPSKQWHSAEGMPQWIKYELEEPFPICKIVFSPQLNLQPNEGGMPGHYCLKKYKLQGSNDDRLFETLLEEELSEADCVPNREITNYFDHKKSFKFYRLDIFEVFSGQEHQRAVVGDIQLFSINDLMRPKQYTLKDDKYTDKHVDKHVEQCPEGQGICGIDTRVSTGDERREDPFVILTTYEEPKESAATDPPGPQRRAANVGGENKVNQIDEIKIFCCKFPGGDK